MNASSPTLVRPVIATSLGFALVQLDVTIVNVALPGIGGDLDASLASLQWVVDGYTLSFAVLLLAAGALSDRLGGRAAYAMGFATFGVASLLCSFAADARWLVAARTLQGVGAALLVPSSLALLNAACRGDGALRARAVGFWTAAGGASIAAGPILGGALLAGFGWRSIFWVNVPICVIALLLAFRWLPRTPPRPERRSCDVAGQLLAIAVLTLLVATIIEAPGYAQHPAWIAAAFAAVVLGVVAFCIVETRAASPMLPLAFFARPHFSCAMLFGVAANLTYYGIVFVLSLYLQDTRAYSALDAGLAYLPLTATFIVSNVASGSLVARFGTRVPMVVGASLGAVGFGLLARLDATSGFLAMLPGFVLVPLGMGLAVPAMTTTILASVEPPLSATASGALNAARQVGGAVGVAGFGALVHEHGLATGLHVAACVAMALMGVAALVVFVGTRNVGAALHTPRPMRPRAVTPMLACKRTIDR